MTLQTLHRLFLVTQSLLLATLSPIGPWLQEDSVSSLWSVIMEIFKEIKNKSIYWPVPRDHLTNQLEPKMFYCSHYYHWTMGAFFIFWASWESVLTEGQPLIDFLFWSSGICSLSCLIHLSHSTRRCTTFLSQWSGNRFLIFEIIHPAFVASPHDILVSMKLSLSFERPQQPGHVSGWLLLWNIWEILLCPSCVMTIITTHTGDHIISWDSGVV